MLAKKGRQEVLKPLEKEVVKEGVKLVEKAAVKKGMQEGIMKSGEAVMERFGEHAINQAISRGFKTPEILEILRQGNRVHAMGRYGPQIRYTLGRNTIILNNKGEIITMFSNFSGTAKGLGKGSFIPFK